LVQEYDFKNLKRSIQVRSKDSQVKT
jgi:hypothetical protein